MRARPADGRLGVLACLVVVAAACDNPARPEFVKNVRLVPDSAMLAPGETVTLRIRVFTELGDSLPDRAERVQVTNGTPDVIATHVGDGEVRVTALRVGVGFVTATLGFGIARAPIVVTQSESPWPRRP